MTLDHFDGKVIAQAWVHQLNTNLAFCPMLEEDDIHFVVLHLDKTAHDRWYHGLATLNHDQVTSYQEFVDRLVERFDQKDTKTYF